MKKGLFIGVLALFLGFAPLITQANSTIFGTGNSSATVAYFCFQSGCVDDNGKSVTVIIYNDAKPNDLSGTFANVSGTIYNKTSGVAYSTPQEFFDASGVSAWTGLTFDTTWVPGTPPVDAPPVKPTINVTPTPSPGSTPSVAATQPTQMLFLQVPGGKSHNTVFGSLLQNLNLLATLNPHDTPGYLTLISNNNVALDFILVPVSYHQTDGDVALPAYVGLNGDAIRAKIQDSQPGDTITYQDTSYIKVHSFADTLLGIQSGVNYLYKIVATDVGGNKTTLVNYDNGPLVWIQP